MLEVIFSFSHLYGSNRSWMPLKDCYWCTSSKTPHSYNLITAACSNKSVFIVYSHVRYFSRVSSKCSKEASIICCPNFHQTVIWTLWWQERTEDLQWSRYFPFPKKPEKQREDFIKSLLILYILVSSLQVIWVQ